MVTDNRTPYLVRCGLIGAALRYEGVTRSCGAINGSSPADTESGRAEGVGPYDVESGYENGGGICAFMEPDGICEPDW